MQPLDLEEKIDKDLRRYKENVHWVLAHSYSFYLLMFVAGMFFDIISPIKIVKGGIFTYLGFSFIVLATILIYWAQITSKHLNKNEISKKTFSKGPYFLTRSPTHWGLFFLMFGFGLAAGEFFVVVSSLISLIITKFVFLKKEEKILKKKYGDPYIEYKKSMKL